MQPEGTEAKLLWGLEGLESGRLGAPWAGALTCCSLQVKDCTDHVVLPMDGATLSEVMRQRGITPG